MTNRRLWVGLVGSVLVVCALALTTTAKSVKRDCIDDDQCNMVVGSIDADTGSFMGSNGWVQAKHFYGKVGVHAGPNDESTLDEDLSTRHGFFDGHLVVVGDIDVDDIDADHINANSKSFKIDHPIDPANKYLNHWSVESDDLKNIYDGVVTLDGVGRAIVTLPNWLGALNDEYRYQLTPVGGPGSGLYIEREMSQGRFAIAGGSAGLKVSWQLTGVRKDPSAAKNRKPVEEDKADGERGLYKDPEAFGRPNSERIRPQNSQKPLVPSVSAPQTNLRSKAISRLEKAPSEGLACMRPQNVRTAILPIGLLGIAATGATLAVSRRHGPKT